MMEGATSLTMSVPNIITSSPSGGRFDFDDGGTYCGGWQDDKAHGHGVCTGPKNVGEYSGSWNFGFEMSGVYKWTNGAVYEGRWQNGKRHGVGVEYNGKWIYKGEWSQGLKGRYGVKASSNSAVKYEGTWANGLQDGYGSETYSDGGYYQGQMCRGLRHGYGVRKSAPYGDSQLNNPSKNGPLVGVPSSLLIHSNSMQSSGSAADLFTASGSSNDDDSPKPEDGFKPNIDRTLVSKNGFVLVAKPLEVPMSQSKDGTGRLSYFPKRRSSLTNRLASSARIPNQTTASLLRGLRLKKQKSTSDLDALGPFGRSNKGALQHQQQQMQHDNDLPMLPFTLSPEELDITDPTTVETYTGEWKHDKRNGHGVCDRSDGLRYEGQWHNDMKCGYGVTTLKDGTKEEGKYKNNILIADSKVKRFFQLGGSNIRQRIDDSVKMAQQAQTMALKKAEIADTRAATARDKADQAMTAAIEANRDSQIAYAVARQYSSSSLQQQQQLILSSQSAMSHGGSQIGLAGGAHFFGQNAIPSSGHEAQQQQPYLQGLNIAASALQMRRISQHQQRHYYDQPNSQQQQQQHQFEADPMSQQHRQPQNGHYLSPVKPFNGRRGSFRGSLSQPPSSGHQTIDGRHNVSQQQFHARTAGPNSSSSFGLPNVNKSSADPFGDLFDHYKSSSGGNNSFSGAGLRSRRTMLSKQTSLDAYNSTMRHTSVPRQLGASGQQDLKRQFRNSSLDQADENSSRQRGAHLPSSYRSHLSLESIQQQQQHQDSMQQQLRHLVTSGEQLRQNHYHNNASNHLEDHYAINSNAHSGRINEENPAAHSLNTPTPTNSSYILPRSSGAGSSSAYNQSNHTPSPSDRANSQGHQSMQTNISPSAYHGGGTEVREDMYAGLSSQLASNYPNIMMHHQQQQRDVQSLADEQLYMSGRRWLREGNGILERTEFRNYDFAICSGPRPIQRCRRRTASLSRTIPDSTGASTVRLTDKHDSSAQTRSADETKSGSTTLIDVSANGMQTIATHLIRNIQDTPHVLKNSNVPLRESRFESEGSFNFNNEMLLSQHLSPNSGHSSASASPLNRKPSLQVRYDTNQMGGLMSREEVAALSHAQREQKRMESELAEKRARQPLLYLFLSLKEFILNHQMAFIVLVVNICLMKMFSDLIV